MNCRFILVNLNCPKTRYGSQLTKRLRGKAKFVRQIAIPNSPSEYSGAIRSVNYPATAASKDTKKVVGQFQQLGAREMLNYVECYDHIERAGILGLQETQAIAKADYLRQPVRHLKRRSVDTFEVMIAEFFQQTKQRTRSASYIADTTISIRWKPGLCEPVEVWIVWRSDTILPEF